MNILVPRGVAFGVGNQPSMVFVIQELGGWLSPHSKIQPILVRYPIHFEVNTLMKGYVHVNLGFIFYLLRKRLVI
jgi:hypothetical protein